jgi:hypothetical protein
MSIRERFLGIIGAEILLFPSLSDYTWTSFGDFLEEIEVYSLNFSKMTGNFPKVLSFDWLFRKLHSFICKGCFPCSLVHITNVDSVDLSDAITSLNHVSCG